MLKSVSIACALALVTPVAARANPVQAAHPHKQALPDEVTGVETTHSSAAGTIVGDAIGGAAVGALVGGGVAAYHNYVQNEGWGNWQRDVLIGAGVGLGVGLILGVASAASNADRTFVNSPVADQNRTEIGFSDHVPVYGAHF